MPNTEDNGIMPNNDVLNYINVINNSLKNTGKRGRDILTYNDIYPDIKTTAIDRLEQMSNKTQKFKGRELTNFIRNMQEIFKQVVHGLKNDQQIKKELPDIIRLGLIAEISICCTILDDVYNYALVNRSKTFTDALKYIKNQPTDTGSRKKYKKSDEKILDIIMLRNESDSDEYEEDSEDPSSSEEEEDNEEKETPLNGAAQKFVQQIFKVGNHDTEEELIKYYSKLPASLKKESNTKIKEIINYQTNEKPVLFQIMEMPLTLAQRNYILKTYSSLVSSRHPETKLRTWFDSLMTIPFGKYKGINLKSIKPSKVKEFLDNLQLVMDQAVFGHDEAKRQIIQMMGQQIRNPSSKGNMLGLWGPPGNGKCFALDTPILMYDGQIKKVQNVQVGDVVMGDDSKPRNVLSLGRGEDEMYDIETYNGFTYTVNSEHILCLNKSKLDSVHKIKSNHFRSQYFNPKTCCYNYKYFDSYNTAKQHLNTLLRNELDSVVEITVKDYLKLSNTIKRNLMGYRCGIDFSNQIVSIDPYDLGYYLGQIQRSKVNILDNPELKQILNNPHIPDRYKINDRKNRLKLLAGLIDEIGVYDELANNYFIAIKYDSLLDDLMYLCRSLGFSVYYQPTMTSEETIYTITVYGNHLTDIPVMSPSKQAYRSSLYNPLSYRVVVKSRGVGNYYGFTLDGNNRFLLGDFTVTHNTSLIKDGIAKAMDKSFIFISLGGATDASFLEGHSYTYEGSIYGRIVNGLITSKCMDPIIYFDELDKISKTPQGDEITNILIHLTDPVQNSHFRDKYFHGIDIDLSRATMIFSFNDPSNVNPVLLDRITTVETKFLMITQKIHIAKNYLLPEIMKDMGFNNNDIVIDDDTLRYLINSYTYEGGVRKLKSILYNIVRELNLANLIKTPIDSDMIQFPLTVQKSHIKTLLKHKMEIDHDKIHTDDKTGVVNGLWANSLGNGGILEIQTVWIPTQIPLSIKATGHLEKVIKESTDVACSVAWKYITDDIKTKFLADWKNSPMGFHIHCPDGATPKDGPSAGAALSLAIYSLLTNKKIKHDIAMTGEINLEGNVTAIGGLEEKLEGAKRAGVKLVLFPKENKKHLEKIKQRNSTLLDDDFKVIPIKTFDEVLKYSLIE